MEDTPYSSSSSSSASTSQLQVEETNQDSQNSNEQNHEQNELVPSLSYRVNISMANPRLAVIRDNVCSCLSILITFWFIATMGLILGIYGTTTLQLGPYSSVLIQVNSIFVQSIKAEQIDEAKPGIMLYGFDEEPVLGVRTNWTRSYNGSVPRNFYKEWIFYLNKQSQLDIFYDVKSPRSSYLSLVIAEGREELLGWIEKPLIPNTTLSWNIIYGRDKISQKISDSFSYYVALGNLHSEDVEVEMKFSVSSVMYNTSNASSRCSPDSRLCGLDLFISQSGSAVLTTPPPAEGNNFEDEWFHVKLSYSPRWITYFVASGILTVLIFFTLRCCDVFYRYDSDMENLQQVHHVVSEQTPLLANKTNDASSLGSSYESFTSEEEGGEAENSMKHLCVICFDALRDCFFLPCGHSATCFQCGTRVVEEASPCPICRRKIKKVRKIFTV